MKKKLKKLYEGILLLELAIVLGIIAVLMCLTLPHFSFLRRYQVQSEIEKLYSFFTFLQQRAIASNAAQKLTFNQRARTYCCSDGYQEQLGPGIMFGTIAGVFGPPSAPTKAIQEPITFKNQQVTFLPDGGIDAGTVYLVDISKKYMAALTSPIAEVSYLRKYHYHHHQRWILSS